MISRQQNTDNNPYSAPLVAELAVGELVEQPKPRRTFSWFAFVTFLAIGNVLLYDFCAMESEDISTLGFAILTLILIWVCHFLGKVFAMQLRSPRA